MGVNLDYASVVLRTAHRWLLVAYAALVGLVEGPAEILAVAVLLSTIATGGLSGFRPRVAEIGILVWGLAGIPGIFLEPGDLSSGDTTRPLLALTFLVGARAIGRADDALLGRLAWAFGIACVFNGAYGLLQRAVNQPLPLEALLLKNPGSAQIYIPNHVFHVRAASGLFHNRLKLAHVGMVGAFLIAIVAMSRALPRRTRVLASIGGLFLGGGVLFTYARMAFVSVAAAALSLAAVLRRWLILAGVLGVSFVAAAGVLMTSAGQRRMASLSFDFGLRRTMAEAALGVFADHPVLGAGHGVYRNAVVARGVETLTGTHLVNAHNLWLQVLAETGIVGFLGFNVAIGWCLYVVARRVARRADGAAARLDRLALLGLLAILFVGMMHFSLHHAPVGLVFWTLAGVCVRTEGDDGEKAQEAAGA